MTKHIPIEKAAERYLAGESSGDIASEHGVTARTLRRKLIAHGVTMRPRGGRESLTAAQAEALVRDFKAGDKQEVLCLVYGVSRPTVCRTLRAAGVKRHDRR